MAANPQLAEPFGSGSPLARQLKITHVTGPLASDPECREQVFAASDVRVRFGTLPGSDVRYPATEPGISREHLVLARDVGRYEVRVDTDSPVFINGRPALDGEELRSDDHVALGTRKGPSFLVQYLNDSLAEAGGRRMRDDTHYIRRGLFLAHVSATLVLAIALMFLSYGFWQQMKQSQFEQETARSLQQLSRKSEAALGGFAPALGATADSLYVVSLASGDKIANVGTAWVVADAVLATNAHVAKVFEQRGLMGDDMRLIVRPMRRGLQPVAITGVTLHPGYELFAQAWDEFAPAEAGLEGGFARVAMIPAFDVALLHVEAGAELAPPLQLAAADELRSLRAGTPVAYVGFPMEGLDFASQSVPIPISKTGTVSSVTNFTRTKVLDEAGAELIVHSLPGTGGASGSPIINRDGHVIALFNAGEIAGMDMRGNRLPSPVAVNYAQSVAVLRQLLDGAALPPEQLRERIRAELAGHFDSVTPRMELAELLESWVAGFPEDEQETVLEHAVTVDGAEQLNGSPAHTEQLRLRPGAYIAYGYSDVRRDIDLAVFENRAGDAAVLGMDEALDGYPLVPFVLEQAADVSLVVLDRELGAGENSPAHLGLRRLGDVPQ